MVSDERLQEIAKEQFDLVSAATTGVMARELLAARRVVEAAREEFAHRGRTIDPVHGDVEWEGLEKGGSGSTCYATCPKCVLSAYEAAVGQGEG